MEISQRLGTRIWKTKTHACKGIVKRKEKLVNFQEDDPTEQKEIKVEEPLIADGILKLLGLRMSLAGSKMPSCSEYMGVGSIIVHWAIQTNSP